METFEIKNLSFTYPGNDEPALKSINLSIKKGSFFVLCGLSGCGKTTLLRRLKPSIAPVGLCEGEILFLENELDSLEPRDEAALIGFVSQSPDNQLVTDKVWHELAFGMESLGLDSDTIRRRSAEMTAFFGLEPYYYKNVDELSGGQKQLLCLASIMTMQPEVLVLDEPTSQLDPIAAEDFLAVLARINREFGTTIILSEHRLEEALPLADACGVMDKGSLLFAGTPRDMGNYLRNTNNSMFEAMPTSMRIWASVNTELPCPITVNEGNSFIGEYLLKANQEIHPVVFNGPKTNDDCERVIYCKDVHFRYEKDEEDILRGLNMDVKRGELFCILGGNGAGKSTTLKILAGIKKAYSGEVSINGKVGMLPQDVFCTFVKKTVKEDLMSVSKDIDEIANLCNIKNLLDRHPYDLSGGEAGRAALAKVLLMKPDILLLDESTKGMDAPYKKVFAHLLKQLNNEGVTIIMVSHDTEFCAAYADRCGMFFDGKLVAVSDARKFFSGNSFYTTSANRMAREYDKNCVTPRDVIGLIGGEIEEEETFLSNGPRQKAEENKTDNDKQSMDKLPRWRMILSWVCALLALGVFIYAATTEDLRNFIDIDGATTLGIKHLVIDFVFIILLILIAVLTAKRTKQTPQYMEAGKRKLSKRTKVAIGMILLAVPLTLFVGLYYLDIKQYYITALLVLAECMLPFFMVFEGKKPKARELVIIATLCAIGIAGRAVFFMLPQFKPVIALTIIAGIAFGGETGFLVGAVSMLVSNILFSQGPWTPWQMFATGIIGFLAGVLYKKGMLRRSRLSMCIFGVLSTFIIFGGIMNLTSALLWSHENLNINIILSYYVTGFPMDAVYAFSTAIFIWFGAEPMLEKLDRVKEKYGLIE